MFEVKFSVVDARRRSWKEHGDCWQAVGGWEDTSKDFLPYRISKKKRVYLIIPLPLDLTSVGYLYPILIDHPTIVLLVVVEAIKNKHNNHIDEPKSVYLYSSSCSLVLAAPLLKENRKLLSE